MVLSTNTVFADALMTGISTTTTDNVGNDEPYMLRNAWYFLTDKGRRFGPFVSRQQAKTAQKDLAVYYELQARKRARSGLIA